MRFLIAFFCWFLLLAVCWPLALLALVVLPLVWLIALPFRVLAAVVDGLVALIRGLLLLPGRLLGSDRPARA